MPAAACAAAATSTALLASMVPLAARPQLLQPCLLVAAATSAHAPAPVQVSEPVAVQAQAWALAAVVQAWALVVEVQQWEDVQVEVADKTNFSLFLLYIGKLIFIGLRTALREKSSPFWCERTVKFLLFLNNS